MKTIVAIGASNSKTSINKELAIYAASKVTNSETVVADLNDFDLPLYGIDHETEHGVPENAIRLSDLLESADGLVISLAEHNGSYTTAFKNAYDWLSRINKQVWKNKPMLLLSTSPGSRGGASVLGAAKAGFPHMGGNIIADFSLPSFHENFSSEGLKSVELDTNLNLKIAMLQKAI